jgi:hypothetical protein
VVVVEEDRADRVDHRGAVQPADRQVVAGQVQGQAADAGNSKLFSPGKFQVS